MRLLTACIVTLLISFIACANSGTSSNARSGGNQKAASEAALLYFGKMRNGDVSYGVLHSIMHYKILEAQMESLGSGDITGKAKQKKIEELFRKYFENQISPHMLWGDVHTYLDGAEFSVLESTAMSSEKIEERGISSDAGTVYQVFVKFVETKRASSMVMNGKLIRAFILDVPVHYYDGQYFINTFKWDLVLSGMEYWDEAPSS